jgi:hypothetical protein
MISCRKESVPAAIEPTIVELDPGGPKRVDQSDLAIPHRGDL